jgi:hypothetical protein
MSGLPSQGAVGAFLAWLSRILAGFTKRQAHGDVTQAGRGERRQPGKETLAGLIEANRIARFPLEFAIIGEIAPLNSFEAWLDPISEVARPLTPETAAGPLGQPLRLVGVTADPPVAAPVEALLALQSSTPTAGCGLPAVLRWQISRLRMSTRDAAEVKRVIASDTAVLSAVLKAAVKTRPELTSSSVMLVAFVLSYSWPRRGGARIKSR